MPYGHPLKEEAKEQHGATYVGEIKLWVLPTNYPDFDKHVEWFKERKMLFNLKHMELAYLDLPNMSPSQRVGKIGKLHRMVTAMHVMYDHSVKRWFVPAGHPDFTDIKTKFTDPDDSAAVSTSVTTPAATLPVDAAAAPATAHVGAETEPTAEIVGPAATTARSADATASSADVAPASPSSPLTSPSGSVAPTGPHRNGLLRLRGPAKDPRRRKKRRTTRQG